MAKRIQFGSTGGPEVLEFVDFEPRQPGPQEIRVRNHAVGVNYIDNYFRSGLYPTPQLPSGLGTEAAGVVEAVGSEVDGFKVGDRVAYAGGPLGAYSDLHVLPAAMAVHLPQAITFEQAAAVMLKGLTVQYLLRQTYKVEAGETILFHAAAGGVGSLACQWAAALGVKLIGTVSSPAKAERAKALGAWEVIDYSHEDVAKRVLELTDGKKCPVVYDGVGKDTWETSLDCLAPRGLMVSFGNASGSVTGVDIGILNKKGCLYVTRPSLGLHVDTHEKLTAAADELFDLVAKKKIKMRIDQRYTLDQVAEAQTALAGRKTTGATIFTLD